MRYAIVAVTAFLFLSGTLYAQNNTYGYNAVPQAPDAGYVGVGAGTIDNLGQDNPSYQFYGGKLWGLNRFFSAKATAEGTTDFNGAYVISGLVGSNFYPITASRFTPYIGAGTGLGYAKATDDEDALGLDLSGTIGVLLFRGAPVELGVEASSNYLFRGFGPDDNMPMVFTGRVSAVF